MGAQSESVQAKCAIALLDYSGRKPGEKLTIKQDKSIDQIDAEIIELQRAEMEDLGITPEEMVKRLVKELN